MALYKIQTTEEFLKWYEALPKSFRPRIDDRLYRIEEYGHFGDHKYLGEGVSELRWKNGIRVYFTRFIEEDENYLLIIWGGNKNGQERDIKKAKNIIRKLYDPSF